MKKKVLIIENESYIYTGLNFVFTKNGYECKIAENGEDALKLVDENQFDFILTDLSMPIMNGWEAAEQIRQKPNYKDIPIVAYTGYVDKKYLDRAEKSGINEVLTKPLNPQKIVTIINKYL